MKGFTKLHRDRLDHPITSNVSLFGFFCFLKLTVNYKSNVFYLGTQKIRLNQNEAIISQKKLSKQFRVSISTINRRLKFLSSEGLAETKGCNKYTFIKLLLSEENSINGNLTETIKKDIPFINNNSSLDISPLIETIKKECIKHDIVYIATNEEYFTTILLTDPGFISFCKTLNKSVSESVVEIIKLSALIKYWKGICAGPKMIFENYAEVYNKSKTLITDEIDTFILQQPEPTKNKLLEIKKSRSKMYPYKKPFSSIEHVNLFINDINAGKL